MTEYSNSNWNDEVIDLDNYFKSIVPPAEPIILNKATIIKDCNKFVNAHLLMVKNAPNHKAFKPYLYRLKELKQILLIM